MVKGLPDATRVVFDDQRAVADAGVMVPAVLAGRLGIEAPVDETVDLGDRPRAARPGRKVMSLVSARVLGADCIDDCDLLRAGQTIAPSHLRRLRCGRHRHGCGSTLSPVARQISPIACEAPAVSCRCSASATTPRTRPR